MGVYIKGMKMPKSCPCEFVGVGYNTYCSFAYGVPSRIREHYECCKKQTRPEWCPFIEEVPTPHGRLIDADALDICRREQQAWQDYEHNPDNEYIEGVKDGLHEASKQLSTAMTIIEAEGI